MIEVLEHLSHEASLQMRRLQGDLTEAFQCLKGPAEKLGMDSVMECSDRAFFNDVCFSPIKSLRCRNMHILILCITNYALVRETWFT